MLQIYRSQNSTKILTTQKDTRDKGQGSRIKGQGATSKEQGERANNK